MEMFNFMEPKLLPKITHSPVATEDYEASNLISDNYSQKTRGFIAYPSTKPPVQLEFELLCNVNIAYIFIDSTVGNHKCTGIELVAKSNSGPGVSIARAVYDTKAIVFCNCRQFSQSKPPPGFDQSSTTLSYFKSGSHKSFLNASKIIVVIFRTHKSVPCLARVEIWGRPAKSCSPKTVETIHRLNRSGVVVDSASSPKENLTQGFKIPDEFKDDLTDEIMTIPYTLPSGKTVDQITLEKHIESEKLFGRKPGDPFTGIKFTDTLKPILNVGLKSRIDMFLMRNSHHPDTFNLKRTLRSAVAGEKKIKLTRNHQNNKDASSSYDSSDQDLEKLISKAKADINFVSFSSNNSDFESECILCKRPENLYELPCEHYYCRKCLIDDCKNCVCSKCNQKFANRDVKKIHLKV